MRSDKKVFKTFHLVIMAVYAALVYALQVALAFIPNVETVTFMISFAAMVFTIPMTLTIVSVFIVLEAVTYGFADWVLTYVVTWYALALICIALRKIFRRNFALFVLVNTMFGFLFGTVDSVIKIPLYGWSYFYGYWIKGLIFDLIHGVGNFMIAFFLFKPTLKVWEQNLQKYFDLHGAQLMTKKNDALELQEYHK